MASRLTELIHFFKEPTRFRELIIQVVALTATIVGLYSVIWNDQTSEQKRIQNFSYTQQLDALNNVQGSLNNLIQFVEMQKRKLKESEDLVNSLKSEQEKLKPVVEADRKTVDAILELQAQRT